jgi:NitT/TauT family transport system substrate-binding protein
MTSRSTFLRQTGLVCSALAAGGAPAIVRAQGKKPLAISYLASTLFAPVFVAYERGYFSDAGFDVTLQQVQNGQAAMAFAASGRIDLVAAGIAASFYNAVSRGLDVRLIASMGTVPAHGVPEALMVRQDLYSSGLRTAGGLRGKKIAWVGKYGPSMYYVSTIVRKFDMTLADVSGVELDLAGQEAALSNKAIDAIMTHSPIPQDLKQKGLATTIAGPPAGISTTGILAGQSLLKDAGASKAVLGAMRRAARDLRGGGYYTPATLATLAKYTSLSAQVIKAADRYDYDANLAIDRATLQDMQSEWLKTPDVLSYKSRLANGQLILEA